HRGSTGIVLPTRPVLPGPRTKPSIPAAGSWERISFAAWRTDPRSTALPVSVECSCRDVAPATRAAGEAQLQFRGERRHGIQRTWSVWLRYLFTTAEKDHHGLTDDRNLPGNLGADLGGEEGQRVPGQQIPAEAKSHDKK